MTELGNIYTQHLKQAPQITAGLTRLDLDHPVDVEIT